MNTLTFAEILTIVLAAFAIVVAVIATDIRKNWWETSRALPRIYLKEAKKINKGDGNLQQALIAVVGNADFQSLAIDLNSRESRVDIQRKLTEMLEERLPDGVKEIEVLVIDFLDRVKTKLYEADKDNSYLKKIADEWDKEKKQLEPPKPEPSKIDGAETPRTETASECPLPRSNLERKLDELIGRDEERSKAERSKAKEDLLSGEVNILTLTGTGGIGKTLLSKHIANSLRDEFKCKHMADGLQNESNDRLKEHVYFVELAGIEDGNSTDVVFEIARQLKIDPPEIKDGQDPAQAQLENIIAQLSKENVREERLLLVLDNFEHVSAAATYVDKLVRNCPEQVKVLVTSRWLLELGEIEKEFSVEPLSLPEASQPLSSHEDLSKYGATKLFVEQAMRADSEFTPTDENAQFIVKICRSLSGIPFMIKVVAAQLRYGRTNTPQALCEDLIDPKTGRLNLHGLKNKETGSDPDPRHKDALAITAWSYKYLPSDEQKSLFLQLALFKGGFTEEAAKEVCNAAGDSEFKAQVIEGIKRLIDHELLEQEAQEGSNKSRYSMLEVVRECGLDILDKKEEEKLKAENQYVNYFLEQVKKANSENGKVQLEAEQGNLREALRLALMYPLDTALSLAYELSVFWDNQSRRIEAREALKDALRLKWDQGKSGDIELRLRVLDRAALLADKQADCHEAIKHACEMLKLSRRNKRNLDAATALHRWGRAMFFQCHKQEPNTFNKARKALEKSRDQFQSSSQNGKPHGQLAWVHFDLGVLALNEGKFALARMELKKSLKSLQESEDKNGKGTVCVYLAFITHKIGEKAAARTHVSKAKKFEEAVQNCLEKAEGFLKGEEKRGNYYRWYLHFRGRIATDKGDFPTARKYFAESLDIFSKPKWGKQGDKLGIIRSLLGFSWLSAKEDNWEKAVKLLSAEDKLRKDGMDLPFPSDWETEKKFIEEEAHRKLDKATYDAAWAEGKAMNWEQAIENQSTLQSQTHVF